MSDNKYSEEELEYFHGLSFGNEQLKAEATDCGCFYCLEHFHVREITDWLDSKLFKTACCPICAVDSVVMGTGELPVDDALLEELKVRYFGDH
jgi:hypothetical protein